MIAALVASVIAVPAPVFAESADTAPVLFAGGGRASFSGDGGPAAEARLNKPLGAAVAADGSVYIADTVNHRIRAVGPDGVIRTVAGNGGQTATQAPVPAGTKGTDIALTVPNFVAAGADGTVFFADGYATRVYALAPDGTVSVRVDAELLGGPITLITALAVAPDGTLYLADRENNRIVEVPPGAGGRPVSTPVTLPTGLTVDAAGDVWISSAASVLSRLHDGKLATIVEASGGWKADDNRPATPSFNVTAVSAGRDGVYIVDNQQRAVRRLGGDGAVTTVAALPADPFGARDPVGLVATAASAGPLYAIDTVGSRIYAMTAAAGDDDTGSGDSAPVWPWIAGGAVVVVLLAALVLIARRRRA